MSVETTITTIQIVCVLLLAVGTPLYAYLKVLWRAQAAEKRARSARLGLWTAPCLEPNNISDALHLLRLERERRSRLREQQRVLRWEELSASMRPPLLFVYVGELDLIAQALATARRITIDRAEAEVDTFLTSELVSARADGMRYLIDVQDAANRRMRWRKQISYFCAGYTSTLRGVEPSLNATPEEVRASGALLPTSFKAPGYFTVRVRSDYATVRTPLVTLDERTRAIASLPHGLVPAHSSRPPGEAA